MAVLGFDWTSDRTVFFSLLVCLQGSGARGLGCMTTVNICGLDGTAERFCEGGSLKVDINTTEGLQLTGAEVESSVLTV